MSACNCDGTITQSAMDLILGDDLISSVQLNPLLGGFDPRPVACAQATSVLRAEGQDPCNLDSPDDLQVLYKQYIPDVIKVGQGTPVSNALQQAADIAAGTATSSTFRTGAGTSTKPPTNWTFIIGAIAILALGFFLVFR